MDNVIQKKICLIGSFAVGKTSLVKRFVYDRFPDRYITTFGVKIEKKVVQTNIGPINLMLWDLAGEDEFQKVRDSYLRGASGHLIVVDGTRRDTLNKALILKDRADHVDSQYDPKPFVLLLNKIDLEDKWEITEDFLSNFVQEDWIILKTSAKTGQGVEEAFQILTQKMLENGAN